MPAPQAWIQDAADFDIPSTIEELSRLVHLNSGISDFIHTSGNKRDTKFIVTGPKGSGKTLVLKAKRVAIEDQVKKAHVIPRDAPQDKALGASPLLSLNPHSRGGKVSQPAFWKSMWVAAITLAVVKDISPGSLSAFQSSFVRSVAKVPLQVTPLDLFTKLVGLSDDNLFRALEEILNNISPTYRSIDRTVIIFIDSVDDYLSLSEIEGESITDLKFRRKMWVLIQISLAEAIFDLRTINTNIKTYASVRKEALMRGYDVSANAQQLNGISLDISYNKDELRDIFEKNIRMMKPPKVSRSSPRDPFERLLGKEKVHLENTYTGKREHFFDFVFRHSLGRPRDLMAIGAEIERICPVKDIESVREAVFAGARSSVLRHFTDMRPFLPIPDYNVLFRFIKRNKLTLEDLDVAAQSYVGYMNSKNRQFSSHPFCSLFKMGLLGVPDTDFQGNKRQRFQTPHDLVSDEVENILPTSNIFLIHPALDAMINEARGGDFRLNFDRKNIVGDGLAWKDIDKNSYVLIGDVVKSSEWMNSAEVSMITPRLFRE